MLIWTIVVEKAENKFTVEYTVESLAMNFVALSAKDGYKVTVTVR